jgi:hypothetical protein
VAFCNSTAIPKSSLSQQCGRVAAAATLIKVRCCRCQPSVCLSVHDRFSVHA